MFKKMIIKFILQDNVRIIILTPHVMLNWVQRIFGSDEVTIVKDSMKRLFRRNKNEMKSIGRSVESTEITQNVILNSFQHLANSGLTREDDKILNTQVPYTSCKSCFRMTRRGVESTEITKQNVMLNSFQHLINSGLTSKDDEILNTQVPCISCKPRFRMTGKDDVIYKKKAFSLAEALITLTIISLILAATLPVISKRQNTADSMWRYITQGTGSNSSIYYGLGNSQTAIIGDTKIPTASSGSRLLVVTPWDSGGDTIRRSLIDFYQKSASGPVNIGRIAFDPTNMAVGVSALSANTTGTSNTAIGHNALNVNSSGTYNVAIGRSAMSLNTTGSNNTAIGNDTLGAHVGNQTGEENTAAGHGALWNNTTGANNVAYGSYSLVSNTIGNYNTAVGMNAFYSNTTGSNNVANGYSALSSNTIGSNNTALGIASCVSIIAGSGNVCLGYWAGPSEDRSNRLYVDNSRQGDNSLILGDFTDRWVKISGTLYNNAWGVISSDARMKNIGKENKIGLERILKLKVKNYTYKSDKDKRKRVGVIAQELQKVFPDSVVEGPGDGKYKSILYIDTSEILFAMVNSIKQLYSKIIAVTSRVAILEKENNELKKQNQEFKIQFIQMNKRLKRLEANK